MVSTLALTTYYLPFTTYLDYANSICVVYKLFLDDDVASCLISPWQAVEEINDAGLQRIFGADDEESILMDHLLDQG